MPTARLSMRKIRDVLHLRHAQGLTERVIALMLGISNVVVHGYLRRARLAGLSWPLPEELDDEALELLLFPAPSTVDQASRPVPDWAHCQATPTFTSYGDIQSYEVSHDESGPGGRADRKSQSALPVAVDHFVEIRAISSSARLRDRVAGNCAP